MAKLAVFCLLAAGMLLVVALYVAQNFGGAPSLPLIAGGVASGICAHIAGVNAKLR